MKREELDVRMRPVEGFPGYWVTEDGRVWSDRPAKRRGGKPGWMKPRQTVKGYMRVALPHPKRFAPGDWKYINCAVHRLVARAFLPDTYAPHLQVNHKDGVKANNHYTNLEWVTAEQNRAHCEYFGLRTNKGENHHAAALTEDAVREIRRLREQEGWTSGRLKACFGVSYCAIDKVVRYISWKEVRP